jgi:hypothetical protein
LSDLNVTLPFLGLLPTSPEPIEAKESDHPQVEYWNKWDWISSKKSHKGTSDINAEKPSRGGKRASQGINVAMRYVQDENGVIIDGHRATHIRTIAAGIWGALADAGGAPLTWGKGSLAMKESYNKEMQQRFPELALCASDWKAEQIAIDNYPSFHIIRFPELHKHKKKIHLFTFSFSCVTHFNLIIFLNFIGVKPEIGLEDDNGATDDQSDLKIVDDFDDIYDAAFTASDQATCGEKRTDNTLLTPAKRLKVMDDSLTGSTVTNMEPYEQVEPHRMNIDVDELTGGSESNADTSNADVRIEESVEVHGSTSESNTLNMEPSVVHVMTAVQGGPLKIVNPLMAL